VKENRGAKNTFVAVSNLKARTAIVASHTTSFTNTLVCATRKVNAKRDLRNKAS